MDFRSDNVASAAPEIVDAVAEAARGSATPYGGDPWTQGLDAAFSALFETEVRVFPVLTGTAANSVAVATFTPPWGVIYAGRAAHVENDECGAPEFMTGGAKVTGIDERFGKIVPDALEAALAAAGTGEVHWSQPACLSVTQSTEMGQIYTPDELGDAHRHRPQPRSRGPHGWRALRQRRCRQRPEPGGPLLAGRCRCALLRRDQERRARGRGHRPLRSRARGRPRLPPQAGGAASLQDALRLGPACGLHRGRPLAPAGRARQRAKRSGWPQGLDAVPGAHRWRRRQRPTSSSSPCRAR